MQFLDDQGRAIAQGLLRYPSVIEEIANEATTDEAALAELAAVAWLFAKLALDLELQLASATPARPPHGTHGGVCLDDDDVIGEARWSVRQAAGSHA